MPRVLTVIMLVVLSGSVARAEDTTALFARLQRANDLTRLDDPSLKPWHLQANFQLYDAEGKPTEKGTLEEWWAGSKLWKRVYTSPSYTATYLSNKDGLYRTPKAGMVPELLEIVERQYVHPVMDEKNYKNSEIEFNKRNLGNFEADCIMLNRPKENDSEMYLGFNPTYCFGSDKVTLRKTIEHRTRSIVRNKMGHFQTRSVAVAVDITQNHIDLISSEETSLRASDLDEDDFVPDAELEKVDRFEVAKRADSGEGKVITLRMSPAPSSGEIKVFRTSTRPIPISAGIMAGRILAKTEPFYPPGARANHITGDVFLMAVIGKDGHIHDVNVLSSPDPSFAKAAQDAVSRWIYKPYMLNGVPVDVLTQITVHFGS
jgi:TonB family protein